MDTFLTNNIYMVDNIKYLFYINDENETYKKDIYYEDITLEWLKKSNLLFKEIKYAKYVSDLLPPL